MVTTFIVQILMLTYFDSFDTLLFYGLYILLQHISSGAILHNHVDIFEKPLSLLSLVSTAKLEWLEAVWIVTFSAHHVFSGVVLLVGLLYILPCVCLVEFNHQLKSYIRLRHDSKVEMGVLKTMSISFSIDMITGVYNLGGVVLM